jgi:uncharacterized SAM-binding protein YcdF (DUF218 family)
MRYLFRNTIDLLTSPLILTLLFLIVALFLLWRGRRRASLWTAVFGIVLLYLCALEPVSSALLEPLEARYRSIDAAHLPQGIAGIAVLGAGYSPGEGISITGALSADGLSRAAEGVRLAKLYGGTVRLVLSGGVPAGYDFTASARGYEIFAREMGIDPASIVVLDQSLNTSDEARNLSKLFGQSPFLLVTSTYHMRRALLLFEHYTDGHPIPAPTGQHAGPGPSLFGPLVPRSENLVGTQRALHEYLGILAISLGQG